MSAPDLRKLADDQLKAFDTDYVTPDMWARATEWIAAEFPDGRFSFLDVGGGNGRFTDALLDRFPAAQGTLLDNADVLLDANQPHPRKFLIRDTAENVPARFAAGAFDLVFFNWLLHHLVTPSYRASREAQEGMLRAIRPLLSPRGRICVFENLYDGLWIDVLPSRLIHRLTSSRLLSPLTRRMGANTAGCGVCFLSRARWERTFSHAGLRIDRFHAHEPWPVSLARRAILHVGSARVGQYWLAERR